MGHVLKQGKVVYYCVSVGQALDWQATTKNLPLHWDKALQQEIVTRVDWGWENHQPIENYIKRYFQK